MFRWKRSSDPKAVLKELVGDFELASFPATAMEALRLLREEADMAAVSQSLLTDPGLTVKILRTVNSAAFGLRQPATDLNYAVGLLGRSRVESIVLAVAVRDALPEESGLDQAAFWQTSAQRGCLARRIATRVAPESSAEAFTAGLLQDMAVPLLAKAHGDRYLELYHTAENDPETDLYALEVGELGFDHAQAGAVMAEVWNLPESLITAIADHHTPGQRSPGAVEAVGLVRHSVPRDPLDALRGVCRDRWELPDHEIEKLIEDANSESSSLAESMSGAPAAV